MKSIGRRNQKATIQRVALTTVGLGQTESWSDLADEWVLVEPLTGAEIEQARQLTGTLATAVTMPFRTDISVTDRIVLGSRTFQIQSIQDPTARREELRCVCAEVAVATT